MLVSLLAFAAIGCGKSEAARRKEVQNCSAVTLDAAGISQCLVVQYHWKEPEAGTAGHARQHELDSVETRQRDSAWAVGAPQRHEELANCRKRAGDVARCLTDQYAWTGERATAASDSLWKANSREHAREEALCRRQKKSSAGSCLMLYYKWDPRHALALDDSIERARIRRLNR